MTDVPEVAARWKQICARVAQAEARVGRRPGSVQIIAVSKTQPAEAIEAAIAAGASDIGENYVQDAVAKARQIKVPVRWHMIGHLQRNKVARAVELFDVIHSLDSIALGEALGRYGEQRSRVIHALVEVNSGGEASKSGVAPGDTAQLIAALADQQWLRLDGLMTVPPLAPSAEAARPHFRALRAQRDELAEAAPANAPLQELSMGMSDDFEVAIEEGATMVRIGRAIFGERRNRG